MAEARCPASCGELIQGWILGSEKLVSCPVNWYSEVSVSAGRPDERERPRMRAMLEQVVSALGYPTSLSRQLTIRWRSTIPLAKGMASSTADIAATAVATARHLRHSLCESALAQLCVAIEPTDSTLFRQLTLFDHLRAGWQQPCFGLPAVDILLLESAATLNTADYHRRDRHAALLQGAALLDEAWQKLQQACRTESGALLGEATTLSAIASQAILAKPAFSALRQLVEQEDLFGLNVAHSGSVVGLLFDARRHDPQRLCALLRRGAAGQYYPRQHLLRLIPGGVE
ncbi:GHMP kinase [Entomohabitans teleogrylli]|uniref:GHMP family kinase ATP-binding protein n=1 Tax=Entomohabitans teleogrylli TaxID=1384589 RepID=UPI00073D4B02|nr:GHMP kinase [Entomohabitans teleogrylli]